MVSLATAEDSMFDEQRTTYRDFLQEAKLDHITARKWVRFVLYYYQFTSLLFTGGGGNNLGRLR